MGNQYNNYGQAGAMGDKPTASNFTQQQVVSHPLHGVDLTVLAKQLGELQTVLRQRATGTDHDRTVLSLGEAVEAAEKGEQQGVLSKLKGVGKWALDAATEIGTDVAAEVIKKAAGLS